MTQFTAHIPGRTERGQTKTFTYPAYTLDCRMDESGQWTMDGLKCHEADVIDACRKASNWPEIRARHFPMYGFSS